MSGQTVTGLGLQFTDDNKFCYAFSGIAPSNAISSNILDFITNSEYIVSELTCYYAANASGSNVQFKVLFNSVEVGQFNLTDSNDVVEFPVPFLIPPFTHVKIEQSNLSSGTEPVGASIVGKVGMGPRVGN